MRGLKATSSLRLIAAGHAFVQNLRRGHCGITVDLPVHDRVQTPRFTELALCLQMRSGSWWFIRVLYGEAEFQACQVAGPPPV
jgi:hypothetical protein